MPSVAQKLTFNQEIPLLYGRLLSKRIELIPFTSISRVTPNSAVVNNIYFNEEREIPADAIVYAGLKRSNDEIYRSLKGKFKELYVIGDCMAPRKAYDAISEGDQIGRRI